MKAILRGEMQKQLLPILTTLRFRDYGAKDSSTFPAKYWRHDSERVDLLEFQWDKYGRPRFTIAFRPVEHERDLERLSKRDDRNWFWNYGFRASASSRGHTWFKVPWIARFFNDEGWASDIAVNAAMRLEEIDRFLRVGDLSPYLYESGFWDTIPPSEEFFAPPTKRMR